MPCVSLVDCADFRESARQFVGKFGSLVTRSIVDDEDFDGVRIADQGLDTSAQIILRVIRRDDDAQQWLMRYVHIGHST